MTPSQSSARRSGVIRLALVATCLTVVAAAFGAWPSTSSSSAFPSALAAPKCGSGALKETAIDGRVPSSDYSSGRYKSGYRCNTTQVSHQGKTGGFKVERYVDGAGHVCAFYDSTLLFPKDTLMQAVTGLGVVVLDMSRPAAPVKTAQLTSPAMLSPHESLLLNTKRGILGAELGNPATNVSVLDLYDVKTDCRHPKMLSSTPTGGLGHESGFAPDGRTFYITGTAGNTLQAVDVSDATKPKVLFTQYGVNYHGVRVSNDGRRLYVANIGNSSTGSFASGGLRILDVSQIQDRKANPQAPVLSSLTWPEGSIPQAAEPFSRNGHQYLMQFDEYANYSAEGGVTQASSPVGAARIIQVDDPRHPKVVSNIRLAVHQPGARAGDQQNDPGANSPVQGYAAHYCSVPTRTNPNLVACSMILSGLRIFDIRDVAHPKEVGYFNKPVAQGDNPLVLTSQGAFAMSQPAWDASHDSVWYSDGNSGFYDVRLTNGLEKLF
jgi:WD40-like Beta Propeller Repeat